MTVVSVFDTRPYDRTHLEKVAGGHGIAWHFLDFRLNAETAPLARGAEAVCVFVRDQLDRPCLEVLSAQGVRLVALRCTGFNNVDLAAGRPFVEGSVLREPEIPNPQSPSPHGLA